MTFRMKVEDLFNIGEKTIFTGQLTTQANAIGKTLCMLSVDGERVSEIQIEGEVHTGKSQRDLWTTGRHTLDREAVKSRDVWLIAI